MSKYRYFLLLTLLLISLRSGLAATYYASSTGTGSTCTVGSPCLIGSAWALMAAGDTLNLNDGTYTGANSMIAPTASLKGTSGSRITVQAINDGSVNINGQAARIPIELLDNDFFTIKGVNVYNSNNNVVDVSNTVDSLILQRIVAWDAVENGNGKTIFQISGTNALLEDCAGFGIGRYIFSPTQGSTNTVIRRGFGIWQYSTSIGPKAVYAQAYNSNNVTIENSIGTLDSQMGGTSIDQPYGLLVGEPNSGAAGSTPKAYGNIMYRLSSQAAGSPTLPYNFWMEFGDFTMVDNVSYMQSGVGADPQGFLLGHNTLNGTRPTFTNGNRIDNRASPVADSIHADWIVSGLVNDATGVYTRICYQYVAGVLGSTPLWPWPMNQRIIDAMTASGRTAVDVTATITTIFGTIPASCQTDTTAPTISAVNAGSLTDTGATITWTTNEASDSQVNYGLTASYGSSTTLDTSLVTSHSQALSGLTANTLYHYRVKSKDAAANLATGSDNTFTTTVTVPPGPASASGLRLR